MQHGDHYYYYKGKHKETKYYACSKSRTTSCKARLICQESGRAHLKGNHTCVTHDEIVSRDVQEEMRQLLEIRSRADLRVLPGRVWSNVRDEMIAQYGQLSGLRFLPKTESIRIIKRCRDEATGGDAFRAIESEQIRTISEDDEREFLQVNLAYPIEGKFRRLVGFGHPDLIQLMKYPGISLFIDATYSVTPKPFTQTLIVMIYDNAHDLYIPCFYILMDAKDHWSYWNAFQWVRIQTDMACVPNVVVCDFEQALHLGIRDQFQSAHIVGCLFHWKQAVRRKMIELRISTGEIAVAMSPGILDLLTVIPEKILRKKGIPFVMKKLYALIGQPTTSDRKTKWAAFWDYFVRTWCDLYEISCWNISGMLADNVEIVNRTNNPLESYNRRLAEEMGTSHPSILHFVQVLKEEANRYLAQLADVRHRRQSPPQCAERRSYPDIPPL